MYKLIIPRSVENDLKKLPPQVQRKIVLKHLPAVQANPQQGKFLQKQFRKLRKYRLSYLGTEYRIVYKVSESVKLITIIMIGSRENFYERLKRRL